MKLFADDTNLFISGRNIDLLNQKANESLKHFNNWFLAYKLSLNLNKTCYTVFPSHNDHTINLKLNGTEIKRVNSCHDLSNIIGPR